MQVFAKLKYPHYSYTLFTPSAVLIYIEIYLLPMASIFASLAASISGFRVVLFLAVLLAVAVWLLLKELKEK